MKRLMDAVLNTLAANSIDRAAPDAEPLCNISRTDPLLCIAGISAVLALTADAIHHLQG
jgi:hypothetical protein